MSARENGDGSACGDDNKSIPSVGKVNEQENGPGVAGLPADCNTGVCRPRGTRQSRHSRTGASVLWRQCPRRDAADGPGTVVSTVVRMEHGVSLLFSIAKHYRLYLCQDLLGYRNDFRLRLRLPQSAKSALLKYFMFLFPLTTFYTSPWVKDYCLLQPRPGRKVPSEVKVFYSVWNMVNLEILRINCESESLSLQYSRPN